MNKDRKKLRKVEASAKAMNFFAECFTDEINKKPLKKQWFSCRLSPDALNNLRHIAKEHNISTAKVLDYALSKAQPFRYRGQLNNPILRVYIDTSILSALTDDVVENKQDVIDFLHQCKKKKYDLVLSEFTLDEISKAPLDKKAFIYKALSNTKYRIVDLTRQHNDIFYEIIKRGILTKKHYNDIDHVASAIEHQCDVILSYNMHFLKLSKVIGYREISLERFHHNLDVTEPKYMLKEGEDND